MQFLPLPRKFRDKSPMFHNNSLNNPPFPRKFHPNFSLRWKFPGNSTIFMDIQIKFSQCLNNHWKFLHFNDNSMKLPPFQRNPKKIEIFQLLQRPKKLKFVDFRSSHLFPDPTKPICWCSFSKFIMSSIWTPTNAFDAELKITKSKPSHKVCTPQTWCFIEDFRSGQWFGFCEAGNFDFRTFCIFLRKEGETLYWREKTVPSGVLPNIQEVAPPNQRGSADYSPGVVPTNPEGGAH